MFSLKNKLASYLFRAGTWLLYGWWPEHVNVSAVPPPAVRERMLQELREQDLARAQMIAELVERHARDDSWPDLYELSAINTVGDRSWN